MKSYLDLVPISAKVHKRQNRMSVFCIILAVFLVTVIFGMADMFIRGQIMQTQMQEGNWHTTVREISDEQAEIIAARPDVAASSWYSVLNYQGDQGYALAGKNALICGSDESFMTQMQTDTIVDGNFPQKAREAMISENTKTALGLEIGDQISVSTPDSTDLSFTISGFVRNVSKLMQEDSYGIFLTTDEYRAIYPGAENGEPADYKSIFYIQFANRTNIQNAMGEIKSALSLSDNQLSENTKLLGLMGQSGQSFMLQIYGSAAVLCFLVLFAGVMMITSSLNSNIAQRTEFFGMMRCLGATPKQVMKFIRKEALGWCRFAIPCGVTAGMILIWILCAMLRFLSPEFFIGLPALAVSVPSILAGICMGILTVLLAARSPAKRASKVSPLAAVSGNANDLRPVRKAAKTTFFKIETALGFHHAKSSKKNFVLIVASFSLSIILFLAFSVTVDFMHHSLAPLKPWTPDISVISPDNTNSIKSSLLKNLQENPAVEKTYGRMFAYDVPVTVNGEEKKVDLISYDEHQFKWAEDYLLDGSVNTVQSGDMTGLVVYEQPNTVNVGDTVILSAAGQQYEIQISGLLSSSPFNNGTELGTIICSESTFRQLTGQADYTIIDIQLTANATSSDVDAIHSLAGSETTFSDKRLGNRSVIGSYYSFGLFIYGFMTLIALITIFNIVNNIAMSVSARLKQYGAFRAIGLSIRQLVKMIIAEALTYAIAGTIFGSVIGLMINKLLYEKLITFQWGDSWIVPFPEMAIIAGIVILSAILAVCGPAKRIQNMSIVDTISAQ